MSINPQSLHTCPEVTDKINILVAECCAGKIASSHAYKMQLLFARLEEGTILVVFNHGKIHVYRAHLVLQPKRTEHTKQRHYLLDLSSEFFIK